MRAFSGSTIVEQPAGSGRRQPVRQTRTNPVRTASNAAQVQGGGSAPTPDNDPNANPGFFPALTHYTDAITALPKEMIRHNTMLKEVDAKIYGPEAQLAELVNSALKIPLSPQPRNPTTRASVSSVSRPAISETGSHPEKSNQPANQDNSDPSYFRRVHFQNIRSTIRDLLPTLDEKNHVINTANDCLDKQTKRCNSSFPHIEDEISEEARLGSMQHWAYQDEPAEKKGMIAGERTRRAANSAAAIREAEQAALRSESRREALAAKKPRNQHFDSDFDDGRAVAKKAQSGGKGRKVGDATLGNGVGLGIANAAMPPNKKRKVEKTTPASLGVERAMASVYGPTVSSGKGGAASPRATSVNDAAGKKRGRGGALTNGTGRRRLVKLLTVLHYVADWKLV